MTNIAGNNRTTDARDQVEATNLNRGTTLVETREAPPLPQLPGSGGSPVGAPTSQGLTAGTPRSDFVFPANVDGMYAVALASWFRAKMAESDLGDIAKEMQGLTDRQQKVRDLEAFLRTAIADGGGNLSAGEMVEIKQRAAELGLGDEIIPQIDALWATTAPGTRGMNLEAVASGAAVTTDPTWVPVPTGASKDGKPAAIAKALDSIRDSLSGEKDRLKGLASGHELTLQLASQEYSQAQNLASNMIKAKAEPTANSVRNMA